MPAVHASWEHLRCGRLYPPEDQPGARQVIDQELRIVIGTDINQRG